MTDHDGFVRANTVPGTAPLVPEIVLHLASEIVPLWRATEQELVRMGLAPPYWAFAWAGGQALARHILDHPQIVRGRSVLDFGAGSGLVALAAARAGARLVLAADIDPFARAAIRLNAQANGLEIGASDANFIDSNDPFEIILCGDMCYERPLAERLTRWLRARVTAGNQVLLGDPGRSYFPGGGVEKLAIYAVPTTRELEDRELRETGVYRLLPREAG